MYTLCVHIHTFVCVRVTTRPEIRGTVPKFTPQSRVPQNGANVPRKTEEGGRNERERKKKRRTLAVLRRGRAETLSLSLSLRRREEEAVEGEGGTNNNIPCVSSQVTGKTSAYRCTSAVSQSVSVTTNQCGSLHGSARQAQKREME